MKHQDEYRDPELVRAQLRVIGDIVVGLDRKMTLMEVCGGQTHSILKFGLDEKPRLVHRLDKDTFDGVVSRYPDFSERIHELAEARREELRKSGGAE